MENNFKKIEETLNSIESIQPAKVPEYMFARIKERIEKKTLRNKIFVSRNYFLRSACFFAGLMAFNFIVLKKSGEVRVQEQEPTRNVAKSIAETYFSSTVYNY